MDIFHILAIMACLDMALIMVFLDVFLKYSKNVDHWLNRFFKNMYVANSYGQQSISPILWPFPLYIGLIFGAACAIVYQGFVHRFLYSYGMLHILIFLMYSLLHVAV